MAAERRSFLAQGAAERSEASPGEKVITRCKPCKGFTIVDYGTLTGERILIRGAGNEIKINPGKEILDTIFEQGDTIIIDYVGFLYDESNVITKNGAVHFINRILTTDLPSGAPPEEQVRLSYLFQFYEEPLISDYRQEEGEYLIEETSLLNVIIWSGTDLYYIKSNRQEET